MPWRADWSDGARKSATSLLGGTGSELRRGRPAPGGPTAPGLVVVFGQAKGLLQGNDGAAAHGGNEGELLGQIPMLHQIAPAAGSLKKLANPQENRAQPIDHLALHFQPPETGVALAWGESARTRRSPLLPRKQGAHEFLIVEAAWRGGHGG